MQSSSALLGEDTPSDVEASYPGSKSPNHCNAAMPSLTHPTPSTPQSQTLYVPIDSPPTPAPSPGPFQSHSYPYQTYAMSPHSHPNQPFLLTPLDLTNQNPHLRRQFLTSILSSCTPSELLFISATIAPLLKRDFLFSLPPELAIHILSFINDPKTLARASQVSKYWNMLLKDESVWKPMCVGYGFDDWAHEDEFGLPRMRRRRQKKGKEREIEHEYRVDVDEEDEEPLEEMEEFANLPMDPALEWLTAKRRREHRQKQQAVPAGSGVSPSSPSHRYRYVRECDTRFSYRHHFKNSFITMTNWRQGGHLLRSHRNPVLAPDSGVVTSLAIDGDWVVVGLANSTIHVFSAKTGVLARTLVGHLLGVWGVCLVSRGGWRMRDPPNRRPSQDSLPSRTPGPAVGRKGSRAAADVKEPSALRSLFAGMDINSSSPPHPPPVGLAHLVPPSLRAAVGLDVEQESDAESDNSGTEKDPDVFDEDAPASDEAGEEVPYPGKRSSMTYASEGWGQPNSLVVSGGCDKVLRVWDIKSGYCIYILSGHTSTIRCIRVLHNRPIAVTGSRDTTLRVWDVQRGMCLRVLEGHHQSVRCLDVCGNRVVSGSYDNTCRLWDIDTGECIHVLRGHYHQIYSVVFDGTRIASGGLDTTVRVWDARSGQCLALLQGHTALVCQLQLSPSILATGGSDGRVITFCLRTYSVRHRIAAHDSSVTSLQFDKNFLVTGGNDGRVRLYETETGAYIRELSEPCESVWKVGYWRDTCAVMCRRSGKTVMEIWNLRPRDGQ